MWCSRWLYFGRDCGGGIFGGVFYFYDGHVFIIMSNMELCVSVKVSFICNLCLFKLYVWNRSSVFSDWPFFLMCRNVWLIVPYVCPVSSICWAYFEFCLFVFMAWICFLYRTSNVRPVCPTYLSEHLLHFNWYTLLWFYVSIVTSLGFRWFHIVLVVLNAILILVFLNSFVIVLVSGH
jgi:hypothetical protein